MLSSDLIAAELRRYASLKVIQNPMRSRPPKRWKNADQTSGIVLFAQRVEELLFDYTLDSYKAPTLNTHYRCVELLDAITAVRNHELRAQALDSIAEELAASLADDEVARSLVGPVAHQLSAPDYWSTKDLTILRSRARYLREHFDNGRYRTALVRRLKDLLPVGKEKECILELTRDLVVEWVNDGHPKGAIYFHCRRVFFDSQGPELGSLDDFEAFTKLFEEATTTWQVLLHGNGAFKHLQSVVAPAVITFLETPPAPKTDSYRERAFLDQEHEGMFLLQKIEATSALAARNHAERLLSFVSDVARLHTHKVPLAWDPQALVYGPDGSASVIAEPASAVMKQSDCGEDELPVRFARTLRAMSDSNIEEGSRNRIVKLLNLHSAAVQSTAIENQLVSLWSAIETVLPLSEADSRIGRVLDLMVPVLGHRYVAKILKDLHDSLLQHAERPYRDALAAVPEAAKEVEAAGALFGIQSNWHLLEPVFAELAPNPLLCNRIWGVSKQLSEPRLLRRMVVQHEQRIRWQLHRIYRGRNFVTHSGRRVSYAAAIVENLHSYLHNLIDHIEEVFSWKQHPRSIEGALIQISLEYSAHKDILRQTTDPILTEQTFRQCLFGPRV